ncbi:MAG: DUF1587 domain-containing protein [Pseudohongiellaceae bacterium]
MSSRRIAAAFTAALCCSVALTVDAQPASAQLLASQWALLDNYCLDCHSYEEARGGVVLEGLGPDTVSQDPALFEEVLRKLKIRAMPPRTQPQPELEQRARFVAALEQTLDAAALADPHAGTTTIHRLNRAEYANAIRDLFGIEVDVAELLPSDGGDHGFDNIASLLRTSPMLLDRYLTVGLRVADMALGNADAALSVATFNIPFDTTQDRHLAGLPLGTRAASFSSRRRVCILGTPSAGCGRRLLWHRRSRHTARVPRLCRWQHRVFERSRRA